MTAQPDVKTPTEPTSTGVDTSRIYDEGIVAGLLGAATIAIWFLILDMIQGRPLYTPTVLGTALFRGGAGLASPESPRGISEQADIVLRTTDDVLSLLRSL